MAKKKKTSRTKQGGPFLQAATFCERVITENDGVRSLVRMIDTITVQSDKDDLPPGTFIPTALVSFKSGDATGVHQVKLVARNDSGKQLAEMNTEAEFHGGTSGPVIQAEIPIYIDKTGLYWVDVYLNSRRVTRMPLQIRYSKVQPASAGAQPAMSRPAGKARGKSKKSKS